MMLKKVSVASIRLAFATLLSLAAVRNTAVPQKSAVPKGPDNLALADDDVRRLMLLVAPNEHGKITRQE